MAVSTIFTWDELLEGLHKTPNDSKLRKAFWAQFAEIQKALTNARKHGNDDDEAAAVGSIQRARNKLGPELFDVLTLQRLTGEDR